MRWLARLAVAGAGLAAWAAPAHAGTAAMYEIVGSDGSVVGKFSFRAPSADEVNATGIRIEHGNRVVVTDSAPIQAVGRCTHPGSQDRKVVICEGTFGVPYDTTQIDLGPQNDGLRLEAVPGLTPTTEIQSGAGNDAVDAGPGFDTMYDYDGSDRLNGGDGRDLLFGEEGNDMLIGGPGNDRLEGGAGDDRLLGELGNDYMLGGPGNDLLLTGPGVDVAFGGEGSNTVDGRREV